jgi:2-hydroxy-3-oxopropionate reductase
MANLGFIGVGIMGKPMAGHLMEAGNTVHIYDVVEAPVKELAGKGAIACGSCKEVAEKSDIIFTMVPDTPDVDAAIFGAGGVIEGVKSGSIVVDMSSISPIATKEFAKKLADKNVEMLDAPVSGGQVGAENATLSIMVGGKPAIFEKIKPYFELLFASKAGADPAKVREALLGGFAQSRIMDLHGKRMIERTFQPGFRVRHQQKDLNNALQGARALGMSMPGAAIAQELFNALAAQGDSDLDHSALVLALEKLADYKVAG